MIVCSINSTTSQTALNLGRSKLVSIETNKINFDRKNYLMVMKFKLHQEETLPEHQKKFSHKKKFMVCLINYTTFLNQPGLRFGIPSYRHYCPQFVDVTFQQVSTNCITRCFTLDCGVDTSLLCRGYMTIKMSFSPTV